MNAHGICVQARHETCTVCGAPPEQACHPTAEHPSCPPGACHVCRPLLAAEHGALTLADAASVMHGDGTGVFAGWDLVYDTAGATP